MKNRAKRGKTAFVLWGATDLGPPHFSADILWRTGFKAPDPFFLVDIIEDDFLGFHKSYLLTNPLELERASKEAKADEVVNLYDYKSKTRSALANFFKKYGVQKIIVPDIFPCGLKDKLAKLFKVVTAATPFYPKRAIKTDWEIAEIEKAQRAVEYAVWEAVDFLSTCTVDRGIIWAHNPLRIVKPNELRTSIDGKLYDLGFLGVDTIVACDRESADPHCKGLVTLHAHKPIVMNVFPLSLETHYYADMTRTIFKGEPSNELKKMYEAVWRAQKFALDDVKAGIDAHEIYNSTLRYFEEHAYPTNMTQRPMEGFFHGVGHGVGIDIHEPPWINSTKCILEEGNVVTVEPGLYYQNARNHIPAGGIRIEDMVLVTKTGCRNLTQFPKDLESMIIP